MAVALRWHICAGAMLAVLTGCAGIRDAEPLPAVHKAAVVKPAPMATAAPKRPRSAPLLVAPPPTAALTQKPLQPPATAPVRLIGLDEQALESLLGQPSQIIGEAPGKTLLFRRHDCLLSLNLYPDVETRIFHTLSYEVTSDEHDAGAIELCQDRFGLAAAAHEPHRHAGAARIGG